MTPFPLQRILDIRTDRERHVALELARATEAATQAAAAHDEAVVQQATGSRQLDAMSRIGASVGTIWSLSTAMSGLAKRVEFAAAERQDATSGAEAAELVMVAATKDRRMMERLRERHDVAVRDTETARDRAVMDAAALGRYIASRGAQPAGDR